MRVLWILTRMNVGGPARYALGIRRSMEALGIEFYLLSGRPEGQEEDLSMLVHEKEDFIHVPRLGRPIRPADDMIAFAQIHRVIRRLKPDVVHTHMAKAGAIGRAAGLLAGVPVRVHQYHGHTLHGYFGKTGTTAMIALERALAQISSALIAMSPEIRADLLKAGIGTPDLFRIVPPGLELDELFAIHERPPSVREEFGVPEGAIVIGFAGRLVEVKAIEVFLSALDPLLRDNAELHVLIAGDGPELPRVRRFQHDHPDGARVHWLGWVERMDRFYAATDIVALSSRNEGTPFCLIEAAAARRPVVSTRVGGVPDVVTHDVTGLLVPPDAPREFGAASERLIGDPALRNQMGASARWGARAFSVRVAAERLVDLYSLLLAEARR